MSDLTDGMIALDSERGKQFGFTSDKFSKDSYLWKSDRQVVVSFIESKARGNFRALAETILSQGFSVVVPTPLGRMKEIVRKAGYQQSFDTADGCELWTKEWMPF